ncbi:permease [Thiomicrorhabdus immobilis]|uniref:Permease n=2 Tax=Thiomicrorhabdus immobilis TaxID=2791037 RepID=A0ABM7MAT4_9GAMM|nr:permease [Thiomicrorhabdus immobilis]
MLRMAIALPLYLGVLFWLAHKQSVPDNLSEKWLKIAFLGFIGYYLSSWFDLKGLEMISAQLERLTLFTYPIMVALLGALFFKTPLTRKIVISLFISYTGLWIVFYKELSLVGENVPLGTLLVALAALSFSFYVLFGKQEIKAMGSVWFTGLAMSVSSIFVLIHFTIFNNYADLTITPLAWLWLGLLAVFSTVIPSFMISEAIHRIGPAQTGIVGSLGPIMTMGLAIWILNEAFTIWHALGMLCVVAGVSLLSYKNK